MSSTQPTTVTSVDGVAFSGSQFDSVIEKGQVLMAVGNRTVVVSESAGDFPEYAGSTQAERKLRVLHHIKGTPGSSTWRTNLDALKKQYRHTLGTRLCVFDRDGTSVRGYFVLEGLEHRGMRTTATGIWTMLSSVLHSDATDDDNDSGSGATLTIAVPNAGNVESQEVEIILKATAARAQANGHHKAYPITIVNPSPRAYNGWQLDVADDQIGATPGSYDHAADVTATDSLSTGYDVELWDEGLGKRLNLWWGPAGLGPPNNSSSALWTDATIAAGKSWELAEAVTSDSQTTVVVKGRFLDAEPTPFWIAYKATGVSPSHEVMRVDSYEYNGDGTTTLTVARGQRGTTALASITAGRDLWWAQKALWLLIGWSGATGFAQQDDDYKPMVLESTGTRSHNGRYYYEEFCETVETYLVNQRLPRAGSWRTAHKETETPLSRDRVTADGDMYVRWIPRTGGMGADASPATDLAIVYDEDGPWAGHPYASRWELELPVGVYGSSAISYSYDADDIDSQEATLEIRGDDEDGNDVLLAQHQNTNGVGAVTPDAPLFLVAACLIPFDPKRDDYANTVAADPDDQAPQPRGFETDEWTLLVGSDYEAVAIWGAKQSIYQFGRPGDPVTIENDDGDTLELHGLIVGLDEEVTIDVRTGRVTTPDGMGQNAFVRGDYPPVPAGPTSTDITVTDPVTPGTWYAKVTWRDAYN